MRSTFDMFDTDKSGTISVNELKSVLKKLGKNMSDKEIKKMMSSVDKDQSGEVDFDEFCQMMGMSSEDELIEEAFDIFDCNGDKKISANELVYVMNAIGEELTQEEADEMIKMTDKDGDFQINFEEFRTALTSL